MSETRNVLVKLEYNPQNQYIKTQSLQRALDNFIALVEVKSEGFVSARIVDGPSETSRKPIEFILGHGKVSVSSVRSSADGSCGIVFRKMESEHPIGAPDPSMPLGAEYTSKDGDVVVWIRNLDSGKVLYRVIEKVLIEVGGEPSAADLLAIVNDIGLAGNVRNETWNSVAKAGGGSMEEYLHTARLVMAAYRTAINAAWEKRKEESHG